MPHFAYADIIWDNYTETQSNMLESLHMEAIKNITGDVSRNKPPETLRTIKILLIKKT